MARRVSSGAHTFVALPQVGESVHSWRSDWNVGGLDSVHPSDAGNMEFTRRWPQEAWYLVGLCDRCTVSSEIKNMGLFVNNY